MIEAVAIIVGFGGLIAYLEWRIIPLLGEPADRPMVVNHDDLAPTFTCYYCRQPFPTIQQEWVDGHYYCSEHGHKLQRDKISAVKPVVRRTELVQPAEPLPWEN